MISCWLIVLLISQLAYSLHVTHISDCGVNRGCWMLPAGCKGVADCKAVVTWKHEGRSLIVEIESKLKSDSNGNWIALGLSKDDRMGNDTVIECQFPTAGKPGSVFLSHNIQNDNIVLPEASDLLLKDSYTDSSDGRMQCGAEWILDKTLVKAAEKKMIHPVGSGKYTLFLASGPMSDKGEKMAHAMVGADAPWKSAETVRFCARCPTSFQVVDKTLVKKRV